MSTDDSDKDTHDRLVRELAVGANAALVFVNYTPSPEAKFPVALEQSYAVVRWVAERGREANLDGSRLAVAGQVVRQAAAAVRPAPLLGLAPHQYVILRRVERAKQLLQAGTDLSLAEVALHAGFSDQSQLSRHFKRLVGVTPRQLRTRVRKA